MTTPASIRNIAFVGHPSSGKTTLVDALAHVTGASSRKGSVAEKTSICDTEPEEQEKQHTLQMSVVHALHADRHWNFFDTPGYPDFMAETIGGMVASDLVVGVVSCAGPVTYNLRKKLETAGKLGRGRAIVLTHLDGENSDFDATVQELRDTIGEICVPYLLPNESGAGFSNVHTVLEDKDSDWRKRLMDRVMDACENEELLDAVPRDAGAVRRLAARGACRTRSPPEALIPILVCNPESGAGRRGRARTSWPSTRRAPTRSSSRTRTANTIEPDAEGALVGTVFSVKSDPHVGKVSLVRIHCGTLKASDQVVGADRGQGGEARRAVLHDRPEARADRGGRPGPHRRPSRRSRGSAFGSTFTSKAGSDRAPVIEAPAIPMPMVAVAT